MGGVGLLRVLGRVGLLGLVGSERQGGGQLPQRRRVTLNVPTAVAAGLEADRRAQLAGIGPPVVMSVVGGSEVDDDPDADRGTKRPP
jgi:hypothetical protein